MSTLRFATAGESHGPSEVCILEGMPAGLSLAASQIDVELARRQKGYGRGGRMGIEADRCRFVAGVRLGHTLGSPICIVVENVDHLNWLEAMSPEAPVKAGRRPGSPLTMPRPGHADLGGVQKYGHTDIRNVLERASARETVARVAGGAVCKLLLLEVGVTIKARVTSIGGVTAGAGANYALPGSVDWEAVESSPVGCDDPAVSDAMCEAIDRAREAGESLGGVFEVWCWGMCPGLGGYATADARLDGRLLGALGSIPAIKGVEVGRAFENADRLGSSVHDPLVAKRVAGKRWIGRDTNRAGGIEGGMSTGMPIVLRAAMKPIPTLTSALPSVDLVTHEPILAHVERSDVAAVPAARVVGEAMAAYVLAEAYLDKFGGDGLTEFLRSVRNFESSLEDGGLWRRS